MDGARFTLAPDFIAQYEQRPAPFGFNGLGELVYLRTYSRLKADGTNERWFETVQRVVEGTYNMQKRWITANGLYWSDRKAQRSAQEMYERIFTMKFLPPGRGLWAMGSPLTEERDLHAALFNCAFVSTKQLAQDLAEPFCFLMDASMLGIGVGFDTRGADTLTIQRPDTRDRWLPNLNAALVYDIPDTREGWVESVRLLLQSYFTPQHPRVEFYYEDIRPAGAPIKGFGGVSAGPEPLRLLHENIRSVLDRRIGQTITVTDIVDIMNLIGKCVVAGNVRRTAEIAFGDPESQEYLDLKNYAVNPHRAEYGWTSNNSVYAPLGMDYTAAAERVVRNGEPGFAWLDNMRNYSRMADEPDFADWRVEGTNPCVEQSLESWETCCLVETFPANHTSLEDFKRTLKFAYLYAKTVTLGKTPWPRTNAVVLRNRRIGLSQSGVVQAMERLGIEEYRRWCEEGYATVCAYDDIYSEWLTIPRSIKKTSVKPRGTVSLLAGAKPGLHDIEAEYHIRRVRIARTSDLYGPLFAAGYPIEAAVDDPDHTVVVEIPVHVASTRVAKDVSMWEQLARAAFMQRYWADDQVSCTVTFDPATEGSHIPFALNYYQYQLKGVSFLPRLPEGAYKQMPYEAITKDEYERRVALLRPLDLRVTHETADAERFCDGATCTLA